MARPRLYSTDAERYRAYRERRRRGPLDPKDWKIVAAVLAHLALAHPREQETIELLAERLLRLARFFQVDLLRDSGP